jgi:hypothetical protein
MSREIPFSQLSHLSDHAESGGVVACYVTHRRHQVPRDWPSAVSRFLDPGPARCAPMPTATSRPLTPRARPAA